MDVCEASVMWEKTWSSSAVSWSANLSAASLCSLARTFTVRFVYVCIYSRMYIIHAPIVYFHPQTVTNLTVYSSIPSLPGFFVLESGRDYTCIT